MIHCLAALPLALSIVGAVADVEEVPRNLDAAFSEDPSLDASLEGALLAFLGDLRSERSGGAAFVEGDPERHGFFHDALRRLVRAEGGAEPTLLKSFPLEGGGALLTLAFAGVRDGRPVIEAIVELEARPSDEGLRFGSPFERHTRDMRRTTIGEVTFVHRGPLGSDGESAEARGFAAFRTAFCRDAGLEAGPLTYYRFHTLDALLKAYGLLFDARRCNFLRCDLGFLDDGGRRFLTGTGDPARRFEYVREVLRRAPGAEDLYSPAAVGLATCFGGYGLSGDDLDELRAQFRAWLAAEPDVDFLAEYRKGRASSVHRHFSHFVMCAFLCDRVLEEHGLGAALSLVRSGAKGEKFWARLDELLGVDEANFHATIVELIGA
ncbi:MAG: hypothetical protein AAGB93_03260 [Planctomycetota bacterium]